MNECALESYLRLIVADETALKWGEHGANLIYVIDMYLFFHFTYYL